MDIKVCKAEFIVMYALLCEEVYKEIPAHKRENLGHSNRGKKFWTVFGKDKFLIKFIRLGERRRSHHYYYDQSLKAERLKEIDGKYEQYFDILDYMLHNLLEYILPNEIVSASTKEKRLYAESREYMLDYFRKEHAVKIDKVKGRFEKVWPRSDKQTSQIGTNPEQTAAKPNRFDVDPILGLLQSYFQNLSMGNFGLSWLLITESYRKKSWGNNFNRYVTANLEPKHFKEMNSFAWIAPNRFLCIFSIQGESAFHTCECIFSEQWLINFIGDAPENSEIFLDNLLSLDQQTVK